jgi:hypothetical protein
VKFWVGSNDVGPHEYSGLTHINATDIDKAKSLATVEFGWFPVDPRREDKTLRLAVVPKREMTAIRNVPWPNGLRIPRKYIVEIKR